MARSTSIPLGDHFATFIDTQVQGGRYGSASDVVRAGLRLLDEHEGKVRAHLSRARSRDHPPNLISRRSRPVSEPLSGHDDAVFADASRSGRSRPHLGLYSGTLEQRSSRPLHGRYPRCLPGPGRWTKMRTDNNRARRLPELFGRCTRPFLPRGSHHFCHRADPAR